MAFSHLLDIVYLHHVFHKQGSDFLAKLVLIKPAKSFNPSRFTRLSKGCADFQIDRDFEALMDIVFPCYEKTVSAFRFCSSRQISRNLQGQTA